MNTNIFPAAVLGLVVLFAGAMPVRAQARWPDLDPYQKTLTADTFARLMTEVFSPDGGMIQYLRYGNGKVGIYSSAVQTGAPLYELAFAETDIQPEPVKKLAGLKVAIDPGHIGGSWARMEERFLLIDRAKDWPVQEAALNLHVGRLIRDRLAAAGAEVVMVKDDFEPVSSLRPDTMLAERKDLPPPDTRFSHLPAPMIEASRRDALRKQVEREFYRTDEIQKRAGLINDVLKPDLTLCVHFNATGWGDEKKLYEENGLAFFVSGNFMANELANDDQKFYLLSKLLERSHDTEVDLSRAIRDAFVAATGLPPAYAGHSSDTMRPVDTNDYIFARNLAANRQFKGAVIFLEPYFMNNRIVYARIQAGDYEGEREFDGKMYPSIFREYADAVADGVTAYYASHHPTSK